MNKKINKYLKNAYKVATRQKEIAFVAQLSEEVTQETGLPIDVGVKSSFFEHLAEKHPELDSNNLFKFIETLNLPDEIYQLSKSGKLNFFKKLENQIVSLVATGKDKEFPQSNVVTNILISLKGSKGRNREKYIQNIKNTSKEVFNNSGRTHQAPSSDELSQVPRTGVSNSLGLQNNHILAHIPIKISEIQIIPIKPQEGLVGFASFVLNDSLYLGSIGILTRIEGGFRLVYPTKKVGLRNISIFHPINKTFAESIEKEVVKRFEDVMKNDGYNCLNTQPR